MTLPISNQITPGYLALYGYTPQPNSYLPISGTLSYLGVFPNAPVVPGGSTGQPPWLYGPGSPSDPNYQGTFDYTQLPGLPTQPNLGLVQSAEETEFTITKSNGTSINLSHMFAGGAWQRPITGLAQGDATFIFNVDQSPLGNQEPTNLLSEIQTIGPGDLFTWRLIWPTGSTLVGNGYILKSPEIFLNNSSFTEFTLELGDELALFSNSARLQQQLYCGRDPRTSQEAAKIYSEVNGLFTRTFPPGHTLVDQNGQSFAQESPHQFLQALYAPVNKDVRCSNTSRAIQAITRPNFNPTQATQLTYKQTLELDPTISPQYEPFNSIRVYNTYDRLAENQLETQVYTKVSGQPTNTKPWFQGGYTSTTTTEITRGDTLVWSRSVTSGYIPNETIISKADYEADPCDSTPLETTFGTIKTETFALSYQEHSSEAYLITASQNWERGLKPRQITADTLPDYQPETNSSGNPVAEGDWVIYDGILSYSKETYFHTPQINSEVCSKNFIHLQTSRRLDTFGLTNDFAYLRLTTEIDYYQSTGANPDAGQDSFIGAGVSWVKTETRAAYDSEANTFITQPNKTILNSAPPNSSWVRPKLTEITAFETINNPLISQNGRLFVDRPKPETAPFCYTKAQLVTYGNRLLKENNGLAQSKELVVPYFNPLTLGDSVTYSDQNQVTNNYLVFAVGIAQDGPLVTKTILLSRQ